MNIFICDDEEIYLKMLEKIVYNYTLFKKEAISLKLVTTNPIQLLEEFRKEPLGDNLFFLDVEFKNNINGIDLATKIKEIDSNSKVVFVTTHGELSSLVFKYQIEAMDYIEKDLGIELENRIQTCIDKSIERFFDLKDDEESIVLKVAGQLEKINLDQIMFFESSSNAHRITAHLENRQLEFYGKLSEVINLHSKFIRSHHSFVVNTKNITSLDKSKRIITFTNGEYCFTSIRFQKNIQAYLENHWIVNTKLDSFLKV